MLQEAGSPRNVGVVGLSLHLLKREPSRIAVRAGFWQSLSSAPNHGEAVNANLTEPNIAILVQVIQEFYYQTPRPSPPAAVARALAKRTLTALYNGPSALTPRSTRR